MRECTECQFDIDAESAIECTSHRWHNDTWADMCCLCGKDKEMMVK